MAHPHRATVPVPVDTLRTVAQTLGSVVEQADLSRSLIALLIGEDAPLARPAPEPRNLPSGVADFAAYHNRREALR